MRDIILQEIKNLLNFNQCFKKVIEQENEIKILKSKYMGSSIIETREIVDIYEMLNQYQDNLEIKSLEDGIVIKVK